MTSAGRIVLFVLAAALVLYAVLAAIPANAGGAGMASREGGAGGACVAECSKPPGNHPGHFGTPARGHATIHGVTVTVPSTGAGL